MRRTDCVATRHNGEWERRTEWERRFTRELRREALKMGRLTGGLRALPAGKDILPAGKDTKPWGCDVSPAGKVSFPAGKERREVIGTFYPRVRPQNLPVVTFYRRVLCPYPRVLRRKYAAGSLRRRLLCRIPRPWTVDPRVFRRSPEGERLGPGL
jgi:hypothetical protein